MNSIQGLLAATRRGLGPLKGLRAAAPVVKTQEPEKPQEPGTSQEPVEPAGGTQDPVQSVTGALSSVKVVMATGLYKTAAGVVGQRVVKENTETLRGYLTVQLRGTVNSEKALAAIEDGIEHGRAEELSKGPTKRAGLFLAAKNLVEYERLFGEGTDAPLHDVPWAPTRPGREQDWGRALDEVRFGLGAAEAEILQLRFACGLDVRELAYVLGFTRSDVERRIEAGSAYAKLLLEGVLDGAFVLEDVLREVYEVEPPTAEQIAAAKPKVVPLPAGTVIGDRYEIESLLGGGEFAYVYRARDVRVPGHVVALKLLHRLARTAAAREGALRELSLIASAFHPALVQFKDHGWFEDRLWFVMPFYEGEMLLERIERGSLPVEEALGHFEKLARALAALHAAGIRHQDIKPENIFLVSLKTGANEETSEVLPILLDLGVASPNGEMALAGTPMYFPPEIAQRIFDEESELPLTPKADVFALVLSLLHSLEPIDMGGEAGLDGDEFDVDAFLRGRAAACPSGPKSRKLRFLKKAFERWLAFHPHDRPTAAELADEIAVLHRAQLGGGPRRAVRLPSLPVPRGVRVAATAAAMMSLLLVAAVSVDSPHGQVRVIEASSTPAGSDLAVAQPETPRSESDENRLLRDRLATEELRSSELETELARLRRRELGLETASERLAVATDDEEADETPAPSDDE